MSKKNQFNNEFPQLTPFQKEVLLKELDIIDNTLGRIDQIEMNLKNWCLVIWGGGLVLISQHLNRSPLLLFLTAFVPAFFLFLDLIWKRQILKVVYREEKIRKFINSKGEDKGFQFYDPVGFTYQGLPEFQGRTNLWKAFLYKGEGLFYLALIAFTFVFAYFTRYLDLSKQT